MKPIDDETLQRAIKKLWNSHDAHETITIAMTPLVAAALISQIQLAARHPHNHGPTAKAARELADTLQRALSHDPDLAAILEAGWHTTLDS